MSIKQIKKKSNIKDGSITDTKLVAVLSQFNIYELNRLKKFVDSPYFNRNEGLARMLRALDRQLVRKEEIALSKAELWQVATGESKYNDLKFRKLCSDLLKLTEEFLMQEIYEQNSLQRADNLLVAVYNRKIESLYNSALNRATKLSEQYHFRPASYYYYEYSFERNYYHLSGLELARTKQANIERISENLDKFYVAEKLRSYITMIDRQRMVAHDYNLLFMEEIFELVETGNLKDVLPINLYYQVYLLNKEPQDPNHFNHLKELIKEHIKRLPQIEAFEVLDSALNYCISRVNSGNNSFLREYMDLSIMGVRHEILLVNGVLSPWTFRNIVFAGLRLGDFNWVEKFISDYAPQIDEQYRANAVSFNLANLHFYRKDYNGVLKLLQTVEYEDPSYNLNSKIMLMLTYYEIDEIDSLTSLLASFEIYLRRKKEIPADRRHHYMQLIKFMRSLIRIAPSDTKSLQQLRKRIAETDGVVNKDWLLEKIDGLLK